MRFRGVLRKLANDESGLETVEYAIITGLVILGAIATIFFIGQAVSNKFEQINAQLQNNGG